MYVYIKLELRKRIKHTQNAANITVNCNFFKIIGTYRTTYTRIPICDRPILVDQYISWALAKILLVCSTISSGYSASTGPCPSLMDKWISRDGSVRGVPNLQPPRHDSYTALNGFGYECRRGSPTQSSASP